MTSQERLDAFGKVGAIITDSHIVYTSGKHGTAYVDKDMVYPHARLTAKLCYDIAAKFSVDFVIKKIVIDAVVAPEKGGIILSQWVAYYLSKITEREVLAFYAEKTEDGGFVIKRGGAGKFIPGKNILVVEDVLTTGGSVKKVIEVVKAMDGNVVGLGVLCNRGGITPADVADPPELFALVNVTLDAWDEADCPMCKQSIPINTDVGKGRDYLAKKAQKQ
ncbi:MAG: phosphoribosyltransferase family protein [Patescibacteria group bacterium]